MNSLFKTEGVRYLIYIDTDSLCFTLESALNKYNVPEEKRIKSIEKLMKEKVTPIVNEICQECCDNMHSYVNKISFKLEIAADKAIFLGKKKYVLNVHSSEGVTYAKPKFKAKGLEMVRSSTPTFVREKLKDALGIIFNNDEKFVQEYIESVRQEFMKLDYRRIAFPRSANDLREYSDSNSIYKSGSAGSTPMQVRAALLYNHHLKRLGLDGKYPLIGDGDKIRFTYLKKPNPIHENTIAFPVDGVLPPEFKLEQYIDYETQFEKTFLSAMQIILTAIKWNAVETSSLDEFF